MAKHLPTHHQHRIQVDTSHDGLDRRGFLECMAWVGTGVLWTVSGGILSSRRLAFAADEKPPVGEFHFVQISDSHIGFAADANRDVTATLQVAIDRINALQPAPAFLLHTGDLTHGQKPAEFDTLAEHLKSANAKQVFYVPGEHDVFMAVVFPHDQLFIYDYNRLVRDLNGLTPAAFLKKAEEKFTVKPGHAAKKPASVHQYKSIRGTRDFHVAKVGLPLIRAPQLGDVFAVVRL